MGLSPTEAIALIPRLLGDLAFPAGKRRRFLSVRTPRPTHGSLEDGRFKKQTAVEDDRFTESPAALQRRLGLVTAELESLQEEAYLLARSLSHDLAAPLTSTRWMLETLRDQPALTGESRALVDGAIKNLEQMVEQIAAITTHTAIGRKSLHASSLASTERAVARAVANLATAIEESGAIINWHDLPPTPMEPDALVSLFQNLLSNAIKFRRAGEPPRIEIAAAAQDRHTVFRIRDNGMGIDARQYSRLFQPFQRLNPAIPGRGIGLATCRKIVERTGGKIWVESTLGEGATFLFTLPSAETIEGAS